MREFFTSLFGNDDVKTRIGQSIVGETLPHAYLIEGPDGSGKTLFSYLIAAALSCENKASARHPLPCLECPTCQKIMAKNYPDVYFVDRGERASIPVEAIREMRTDMFLSASESQYKVYIIDDAHLMLPPSQNALLKVLEEPPNNVIILLLCNTSDTILGTIKSRTQTIRMSLFSFEDIENYLLKHDKTAMLTRSRSPDEFAAAIAYSGGSLGKASAFMNAKENSIIQKQRECVDTIIKAIAEKSSYAYLCDAFSFLSQKRNELTEELELLLCAVRDLILIKKDENATLVYYYDREQAIALSSKIGLHKLFVISDSIFSAIQDLSVNANVGVVLATLMNNQKK